MIQYKVNGASTRWCAIPGHVQTFIAGTRRVSSCVINLQEKEDTELQREKDIYHDY